MAKSINIFQPNIGPEALENLQQVFDSNWLGRGPKVKEFEERLSRFIGCSQHSLHTVSCATDSIFQILKVLNRIVGTGTVIVPSISFPAVGSAVLEAGFNLQICDVDACSGQIDLSKLKTLMTAQRDVVAVFSTHYGGSAVDTTELRQIVGEKVYVLEDSACALGSQDMSGVSVGLEADFSCWSFDAMKLLVCGEGAAVHIPNDELLALFKEQCYLGLPMKQKSGMDQSTDTKRWWEYDLNSTGVRSVFTDINAAIGLSQLPLLQKKLERRAEIRQLFVQHIDNLTGLQYLSNMNVTRSSNYFFTVVSEKRDALAHFLKENGIYTTFRYYPLSEVSLFRDYIYEECHVAKTISDTFLNLPIHDALTDDELLYICSKLTEFSKC